jgi:hypothetical protein
MNKLYISLLINTLVLLALELLLSSFLINEFAKGYVFAIIFYVAFSIAFSIKFAILKNETNIKRVIFLSPIFALAFAYLTSRILELIVDFFGLNNSIDDFNQLFIALYGLFLYVYVNIHVKMERKKL